ncbi:MAG: polysaccharide deacetylase family protein [Rubrivivax sp.]|nr:polysaccharide deacetylase family protein [Rubrivivax sp.]
MLIKPLLTLGASSGRHARLSTLIFHRVLPAEDALFPDEVHAARFDAICGWLREWFNVLPLDEAAVRLSQGTLPARALALTFDDGYADNRGIAAPILQRHDLPCTFFVATGYLDGGRMWNDTVIEAIRHTRLATLDLRGLHAQLGPLELPDLPSRRRAIDAVIKVAKYLPVQERQALVDAVANRAEVVPPVDLMMSSAQVREMRAMGMQIGAHTVSHPILARLSRTEARAEIEGSKQSLESMLGEAVSLFAYPNGKPGEDYSPESVELVREAGFATAVSTTWGVSTRQTDRHQLLRFTPWDRGRLGFGLRLWRNMMA